MPFHKQVFDLLSEGGGVKIVVLSRCFKLGNFERKKKERFPYFPIQYLTTLVFIGAIVFGQQIAYKKWIIRED